MILRRTLEGARQLLADARNGLSIFHNAGLAGALGPSDIAKLLADAVRARRRGGLAAVHAHAVADPLRPALVSGDMRLSYGELDQRINRLTHALGALGIGPGDRVGSFLKNGHEHLELSFALSAIGAVSVQIGYRLKADEVSYIVCNAACKAIFFHHELAPVVDEVLAPSANRRGLRITHRTAIATRPTSGFEDYETVLATGDPSRPCKVSGDSWGGVMIYTSGTTGHGKGARRDYRELGMSPVMGLLAQLPLRRDDRHLVACPLYHSLAVMFAMPVLVIGGCLVLMEHFDPELALALMARERITSTLLVPTMLSRILALPQEALFRYDTGALRWIMSGAAPLPADVARRVEDHFGPILFNLYGATETGLVTLALPGEHTARAGTIGRVLSGNSIRLLDDAGRDVPDGSVGEMYVCNDMMMIGYHGDANATKAITREGYLSVGDLARRDADGYYYLADRKIDMVISGGVNIYPWEIEQRLHEHPAVQEAAVVGVPDPEWGESLVAWVVPRAGTRPSADELGAFVRETLADYKRPRQVIFVDALPRNPTGKVLKRELRASYVDSIKQQGTA